MKIATLCSLVILLAFNQSVLAQATAPAPARAKTTPPAPPAPSLPPKASSGPSEEAQKSAPAELSLATPPPAAVVEKPRSVRDWLGITLTSQFAGPALVFSPKNETNRSGVGAAPPSAFESPVSDGYQAFNLVSFRFKNVVGPYALDVQTRFRLILNDDRFLSRRSENFQVFRWEAPRFGISGRLMGGETWTLTGALNTDLPYTLPEPFTGFQAKGRTLLATPGMFANLRWMPSGSAYSFFAILNPRFLIYEDPNAAEPEFTRAGLAGNMKVEFVIQIWPTVSYKINDTFDFSVGTAFTLEKQVQSSWNPFVGVTQVTNEVSEKWRIRPLPLNVGLTYNLNKEVRFFPFVSVYPIESMRADARTGKIGDFMKTASVGFEVTGILF